MSICTNSEWFIHKQIDVIAVDNFYIMLTVVWRTYLNQNKYIIQLYKRIFLFLMSDRIQT